MITNLRLIEDFRNDDPRKSRKYLLRTMFRRRLAHLCALRAWFSDTVKYYDWHAKFENFRDRQNATMMLVGDVANRTAILIDDLADTSNTITRAAKLLKKEGAKKVYALITHGVYAKYPSFLHTI